MKIFKLSLLFLAITYTFLSCKQNLKENNRSDFPQDTLEKCLLTEDLAKSMELIKKDVVAFHKANGNDDNCYLALIDTLAGRFIMTSDNQYMECLELISSIRDGYIAEYFPEIGQNLYYGNFIGFFKFTYERKDSNRNPMEEVFVEAIAYEIKYDKDKDKLSNYFDKQINSNNLDKKQKEYFDNLMKKANEFIKKL